MVHPLILMIPTQFHTASLSRPSSGPKTLDCVDPTSTSSALGSYKQVSITDLFWSLCDYADQVASLAVIFEYSLWSTSFFSQLLRGWPFRILFSINETPQLLSIAFPMSGSNQMDSLAPQLLSPMLREPSISPATS